MAFESFRSGFARRVLLAAAALGLWAADRAGAADAYLFSFSGTIDGSDTVTITGDQAQWQHSYWDYPTGVTLNGQAWQPQSNPTLTLNSPALPASLSGYAVQVLRLSGRDVQTAQIQGNSLVMKFDDTPNGSDLYQYNVALIPEVAAPASTAATLHVTATIDGSDKLTITPTGAAWSHQFWGQPSNVTLNGVQWDPSAAPTLPNSGATQFLPAGVSMQNVTMQQNAGRDVAGLDTRGNQVDLYFADNPLGAGPYDVTLTFPGSPLAAPSPGDINTDGTVNFSDILALQNTYGSTHGTWTTGDFNLDGTVNAADLSVLASHYQGGPLTPAELAQLNPSFADAVERAFAVVPEPSTLWLVTGLVAAGAARRRRR